MKNFLKVNHVNNVESMYGRTVYFTLSPNDSDGGIFEGKLLGYGAYGSNPECKKFCVGMDRDYGLMRVNYFSDECFKSKEEYEACLRRGTRGNEWYC